MPEKLDPNAFVTAAAHGPILDV
ncbi:MAG: hypothetical protein RL127_1673, partial [Bacteroidota bacterium]